MLPEIIEWLNTPIITIKLNIVVEFIGYVIASYVFLKSVNIKMSLKSKIKYLALLYTGILLVRFSVL